MLNNVTDVGRALKLKKLNPKFIGLYKILQRIGSVAYMMAFPPELSNLHDVFHASQLQKYISDPCYAVQREEVQVQDNLTVETMPIKIEDYKMKQLRGNDIPLVRLAWGGAAGGSVTCEL